MDWFLCQRRRSGGGTDGLLAICDFPYSCFQTLVIIPSMKYKLVAGWSSDVKKTRRFHGTILFSFCSCFVSI